ncbi:Hypothetical protein BN85408040 [Alteracholeplasma palmae J233]|uniref:Uncharacterized protein n=1 Tax=Alteracholeplasma palmae (strain ATCC 49389 / J233) TaxID=1318466 RepID=U4KRR0_ALTPJ|nr:Hypothetical protein BN85408040 [Alteracholeplasma palmae J233]
MIIILYTVYTNIFSDEYKRVQVNFWNYFKEKYDLPEIKEFFDNSYVLLGTVFEECIKPFYLRLDILPNYNDKYERMTIKYKSSWYFNRFFSNNWLLLFL